MIFASLYTSQIFGRRIQMFTPIVLFHSFTTFDISLLRKMVDHFDDRGISFPLNSFSMIMKIAETLEFLSNFL